MKLWPPSRGQKSDFFLDFSSSVDFSKRWMLSNEVMAPVAR